MTKVCNKCETGKDISEFYKRPGFKDGHRNSCKECWKKSNKKYIENNDFGDKRKQYYDFIKCWDINNLRLIPAKENSSKINKLDVNLVRKHDIEHLFPGRVKLRHL